MLKRLWIYFSKYKILLVVAIVASVITASTDGAIAYVIQPLMDGIFINKDYSMLILMPVILVAIYLIKGVFRFIQAYLIRFIGQKVIESIRNDLFTKIINLPLSFYSGNPTGVLMSRITNDVTMVQSSIPTLVNLLREFLTVLFLVGVIFYMDWKLALIAMISYPLFIHPLLYISKKIRKYSTKGQERMGGLASSLQEAFTGIRVVKAFTAEKQEINKFAKVNSEAVSYEIKAIKTAELASPLMEFISSLGFAAIIYFGGLQVIEGTSTPGTFFSFMTAVLFVYRPIKTISASNNAIQTAIAAATRIFSIMDLTNNITDNDDPKECKAKDKDIEFNNIFFRYDDSETDTLTNINLKVKSGSTVAFVGPSGAGKSTIANLIPRFFDVTKGEITIGGINIKQFRVKSLRGEIGVVSQEPFLFDDTIANNINYGRNDNSKKISIKKIKAVAKAAYADEFIDKLPESYETAIGERGVRLSGGQKQRITIARALLKNPPILILDEATSSLDTESERVVQQALDNLMKGRTSFVIAHRLSTILNADMIVVLNDGKIEAVGKHKELLKKSKTYKKLYVMQFKSE